MTTICKPDEVTFPKHRDDQSADLQALAGDALLRGDRIGWMVLMRAARELETMPEYDSNEGKLMSADLAAMLEGVTRQ